MLTYALTLIAILGVAGIAAYLSSEYLRVPRVTVLLLLGLALGNLPFLSGLLDVAPLQGQLDVIVQVALIVVLFYGGLSIDIPSLEDVLAPALRLATVGALMTAVLVGLSLYGLHLAGWFVLPGFTLLVALTFGSLIAPNDPIAVFSAIDSVGGGAQADTIAKIESGFDDTVVTTLVVMIFIPMLQSGEDLMQHLGPAASHFLWLVASAVAIGAIWGYGSHWLLRLLHLDDIGYAFLSIALTALLFITGSAISASGYVAVFVMGLVMGRRLQKRSPVQYRQLVRAWGGLFRFCEIFAFVTLGILAQVSTLLSTVALPALIVVGVLVLVCRPLQVVTCTARSNLNWRQKVYIAFVALKGLDPAVLSIAIVASVGRYEYLIDLTFAVVICMTVVQTLILTALTRTGILKDL